MVWSTGGLKWKMNDILPTNNEMKQMIYISERKGRRFSQISQQHTDSHHSQYKRFGKSSGRDTIEVS